ELPAPHNLRSRSPHSSSRVESADHLIDRGTRARRRSRLANPPVALRLRYAAANPPVALRLRYAAANPPVALRLRYAAANPPVALRLRYAAAMLTARCNRSTRCAAVNLTWRSNVIAMANSGSICRSVSPVDPVAE